MKKFFPAVCIFLCAAIFFGCATVPQSPSASAKTAAPASSFAQSVPAKSLAQSASFAAPAPQNQKSLQVLLPKSQEALSPILQNLAGQDGTAIEISIDGSTENYEENLASLLKGENAPDLFVLDSQSQAETIDNDFFDDMSGEDKPLAFTTMANMVPPQLALFPEKGGIFGLPLGYCAQGYLVNIEVLAALLGAASSASLTQDLSKASWEQWSQMLAALELYLQKPVSMRVKLGANTYITPAFRPKSAGALRGIFAFANGSPPAMLQSALGAALYAPYNSPQHWQTSSEESLKENLFPSLECLYALLDFETLHMARPEGALFRGKDYAARESLLKEEAELLFANGTALLYRANTTTAFALEKKHPALLGKLALLPVKLPPPVLPKQDDESQEGDAQSEMSQAEKTAAETVAAKIKSQNSRFWYSATAYLCVNKKSENKNAAQLLLLRLFTSQNGTSAIAQELNVYPFCNLLPQTPLASQVFLIVADGKSSLVPGPKNGLSQAEEAIGTFVATELMDKEKWGEDEAYSFLTASLEALGWATG